MSYFIRVFWCTLAGRLKSVKTWLVILLLPVCVLWAGSLTQTSDATPVTVGVVLPESGGEELWSLLAARNNEIMTFVAADADTVDRNVAAGKWDCGFVFAPDFARRVESLELAGSVTLRVAPGSAAYPLVQETVSACITRLAAPAIARDYLTDSGIPVPADLESRVEAMLAQTPQIGVTLSTLDGSVLQTPELARQGTRQFLYWLIGAVMLVRMLFGAADLGLWARSAAVRRLAPLRPVSLTLAARAAADGLLLGVSGCIAMLLLGSGWGCPAVLGYALFWTAAAVLLARFPGIHQALPVCVPFALVISFLLSGVVVDAGMLFPALSGVSRWLPGGLYLRGCAGAPAALLFLTAAALLCALAARALDRFAPSET